MAKTGLTYYSVDTDRYQDRRIKRLRKDFGCNGIAVYDYLLCEIYRVKGCFLEWDSNTAFDVADYFGLKESVIFEIVKYCGVVGLFDRELLSGGIVTSKSIQERYLRACSMTKRVNCKIPGNINLLNKVCEEPSEEEETPIEPDLKLDEEILKKNEPPEEIVKPPEETPKTPEETGKPHVDCIQKKREEKKREEIKRKYPFVDDSFLETFERWMKYKSAKNQSYKNEDSQKSCYTKLLKFSRSNPEVAAEIIEESVSNNWAGFFALKRNGSNNGSAIQALTISGSSNTREEILNKARNGNK